MRFCYAILLFSFFFVCHQTATAQSGCPGCTYMIPTSFPADTLYLGKIPDGTVGQAYNEDISFRMPKTTNPVYAVDSVTPPGLTISKIEILSVDGLPAGLFWQPNQFVFETATQTDGCIKICGTPQVSDSFVLTVKVRATVFVITQETTFPMRMYIGPKQSITEGFTMENFTGCGTATVDFINNVPSNGLPGFSYTWHFGDGTLSTSENPQPHFYNMPGVYPIDYQAIIDTNGYRLESIRVLDVDCVDQLGIGTPDLYVQVKDPDGNIVFNSSPAVDNTDLPYTFPVGLVLDPTANYTVEIWDEDGGLKGGDDECGITTINILSNDTITSGGMTIVLNISHLADTIVSTDTVRVLAPPPAPIFTNNQNLLSVNDTTAFPSNQITLQWVFNSDTLVGETGFTYCATASGVYTLIAVDWATGCTAIATSSVVYNSSFDCTLGLFDAGAISALPLRPNPTSGLIFWDVFLGEMTHLQVFNTLGMKVLDQYLTEQNSDLSQLADGLYHIHLTAAGAGQIYVGKVLVQH
jgi:hypothetical protein